VVIASVVGPKTRAVSDLAAEVCGVDPVRVRDDIPLPMPLDIDNSAEVGVDRVCAAAAAFERVGGACAVASFGTATTIDCVSAEGRFMGGAILPGLEMSYDVLARRTSSLPRVEQAAPTSPFGRNTAEAIVNGVTYGAVGALREIVERFAFELGAWPHLVLTGGAAPVVAGLADFVDSIVPDLSLIGIALAYRRAAEPESRAPVG
jgi:type III pantothenate kinase